MSLILAGLSLYPLPFLVRMAFWPRCDLTRRLMHNNNALLPLALVYGALLVASWSPDTLGLLLPGSAELAAGVLPEWGKIHFVPSLTNISTLFSRPLTAVSAWAHLQFINVFCGRWIWADGLDNEGVVTWHSILLCAFLAPLGFISHLVTSAFQRPFTATPAPLSQPQGDGIADSRSADASASATGSGVSAAPAGSA